ncbi:MAG: helix-turn-helix domain-containing protein [Phycisphaeraceae bacterium]|nr:helix-turn-helix domain-containing protein [Phycisphaeraceae bacterium]
MAGVVKLRLGQFVSAGRAYHVARSTYRGVDRYAEHTHDFAEIFWVEQGRGVHQINGRRQIVEAGALEVIQPTDVHAFRGASAEGFTIVNVAFAAGVLTELSERYGSREGRWAWGGEQLPASFALTGAEVDLLGRWADELAAARDNASRLVLDWFLLSVLRVTTQGMSAGGSAMPASGADEPGWLRRALAQFAQAERLAMGLEELVRLCDRSPEHVNRVVRRCTGGTATELVNRMRLEYAARQLRMTDRPIVEIALGCGFENLGYFYKRFRGQYEVTPRKYRVRAQEVVRARRALTR